MPKFNKSLYSENHDKSLAQSKGKKRAKKTQSSLDIPQDMDIPGIFAYPPPSDEERKALRKEKLRRAYGQDPDIAPDSRRKYENQVDGQNFSEPHILPPRYDLRKPKALPDPDLDTNQDPDLRVSSAEPPLLRIAEIEPKEEGIQSLDEALTDFHSVLKRLNASVKAVQDGMVRDQNTAGQHHAEQILWILEEAVAPWYSQMDSHFTELTKEPIEGPPL